MDCSHEMRRQILFEIRTLCRFNSPYIISCTDAFFSDGTLSVAVHEVGNDVADWVIVAQLHSARTDGRRLVTGHHERCRPVA